VLTSSLAAAEYLQVVVCVRGNKQGQPLHVVMLAPDEIVDRRILLEGRSLAGRLPVTLITAPELAGSLRMTPGL